MKTRTSAIVIAILFGLSFSACSEIEFRPELSAAADSVRSAFYVRDYEGAHELGIRLLEEFPDDAALRAWWITSTSLSRREDDALEAAEELFSHRKSDPWSWFALAGATVWHGDHDERALEVSAEMLEMAPDHPDFIWMRAWALRYHDRDASIPFIDAHLDSLANPAELPVLKGQVTNSLSFQGRERDQAIADEALEILRSVREQYPDNFNAFYVAGSALTGARLPQCRRSKSTHYPATSRTQCPTSKRVNRCPQESPGTPVKSEWKSLKTEELPGLWRRP